MKANVMSWRIDCIVVLVALIMVSIGCEQEERIPVVESGLTFEDVTAVRTVSEIGEIVFARSGQSWSRTERGRLHTHFGEPDAEPHRHDLTTSVSGTDVRRIVVTILDMEAASVADQAPSDNAETDLILDVYRPDETRPALTLRIFTRNTVNGTEYLVRSDERPETFVVAAPEVESVFEVLRRTESLTHGH